MTAANAGASPSSATSSPAADTGASSAAETTPSSAGPSSGADLAALLVAPSVLGRGFAIDSNSDGQAGDGEGSARIADVTTADCSKMIHSDWTENAGDGNAGALRQYKNGTTQEVTEMLQHFESADVAQSYMKNVGQLVAVCTGHLTDPETQTKVTFEGHSVSGLGDEAYAITAKAAGWTNGDTLEAVRIGDIVATAFVLDVTDKDNGSALATKALTDAATRLKTAS